MKYQVRTIENWIQDYLVEATDENEAIQIVQDGDGDPIEDSFEFADIHSPDTWRAIPYSPPTAPIERAPRKLLSSIVDHPLWPELRPYVKIQYCPQDTVVKKTGRKPRFRIEFRKLPAELAVKALDIMVACPACGKAHDPVRQRKGKAKRPEAEKLVGAIYYGATHRIKENESCSKGNASSVEYQRIESDINEWKRTCR